VVWRPSAGGGREVMLVHRSRFDDWTLPKGKHERGETDEQTALREVEEETGLRCRLGAELPTVDYEVQGRPKVVRYWAMTVEVDLGREPDDEVDDWGWVAEAEALARLTYDHDRTVLSALRGVAQRP
jgi:8-oxo-dGTP diphosphatase